MPKSHFEKQMEKLDNNYNKYFKRTLRELQKEYQQAYKDIEIEIIKKYKKMEAIKATNPEFKFSELQQLEDLQKQIDLILEELSKVEADKLGQSLNELYVSDYMDLGKLHNEYVNMDGIHTPMPELNQLQSVRVLESYMNMPVASGKTADMAKAVNLDWWYSPIQGKWFNTRIEERAKKLGYSIESKLKQAIIRGDGYGKVAGEIKKDLDISFRSAKTLVATELRTAEITAKLHQAKRNGYTHMERRSMRDGDRVCKSCQEMDGTIYPIDSVTAGDFMLHPNDRCILVEVVVDDNGNKVVSDYYKEAQEYVKQRAKENAERTRLIREQYVLDKKE